MAAGLDPQIGSVASLFVSRWDVAVRTGFRPSFAIGWASRSPSAPTRSTAQVLASPRWRRLAAAGARPQRLLWASTGTKDPDASDTLYVEALAAPDTINTIPEKTLQAFADHGRVSGVLPADGGDAEAVRRRVHARSAWTTPRSRRGSSAKGQSRSTSRGRTCWSRIATTGAEAGARHSREREASHEHANQVARVPPLTERPAWKALAQHRQQDGAICTCGRSSPTTPAAASA